MDVAAQVWLVARRSILRTLRQPAMVFPTLVFPLILLAVNAGGFNAATQIPGFPTDTYLSFGLSVTFMQGALFASTTAGTELAGDVESGFMNRLSLTPLRGSALLTGQLAGAVFVALLGTVVYLLVGVAFGVDIKAGLAGVAVLIVLAIAVASAFGAIGIWMALRTGSAEAVQGVFPLLFVLFFLSSISLPRDLIAQDWFRSIADWNPVSYMVEGLRSLVISGWDAEALWKGFLITGLIFLIAILASGRALRTRMERT